MNRGSKAPSFPGKEILFTVLISLASLFVLLTVAARVLMLFDHFERLYGAACYVIWGGEGILLGAIARKRNDRILVFVGIVIAIILAVILLLGFILGAGQIDPAHVGLHFALYAVVSLILSVLPKGEGNRKKKRFKR